MGNCIISRTSNSKRIDFNVSDYIVPYNNRFVISEVITAEIFINSLYHAQFIATLTTDITAEQSTVFIWSTTKDVPSYFSGFWSGESSSNQIPSWLYFKNRSDGILRVNGKSITAGFICMFDFWWIN